MQNNTSSIMDIEFEISGNKIDSFEEFETSDFMYYDFENKAHNDWVSHFKTDKLYYKITKTVHNVIFKNVWEPITIEKLRNSLKEKLDFLNLIKIKLEFNPDTNFDWCCKKKYYIETSHLFGWIYYDEEEKLKTFRFILNISTGEIKYLLNN